MKGGQRICGWARGGVPSDRCRKQAIFRFCHALRPRFCEKRGGSLRRLGSCAGERLLQALS
eukprot:IDg7907t1